MSKADCCHATQEATSPHSHPRKKFYKNSNLWITIIFALLYLGACCFSKFHFFRETVGMYFGQMIWAVTLGWLLGGVLDRYVPREYVSKLLSRNKKRSIGYAVLLGFLMSACSHGILALSIELHKKGASNPVVVSFLLASPWANLPITLLLVGLFGLKALYIIFGALVVALTTGLIFQRLEKWRLIESNPFTLNLEVGFSVRADIARRLKNYKFSFRSLLLDGKAILLGSWALVEMTWGWILLGVGLSALSAALIPPDIFKNYMGPTFTGMLATLLLATVLEVCSEGTAPLSFEIFKQTGAFGNAFVFLMAGVITDYTEIGLIWKNIGRKTALWIPAIAVPQVLILGLLANFIFRC